MCVCVCVCEKYDNGEHMYNILVRFICFIAYQFCLFIAKVILEESH